jgi:serine/threonine protein kinase
VKELAGYRLVRRLAVGGMAELFEAQNPELGAVVVKIVLPQYARDPEFGQMLEDEARLCERLDHENLVRVLDHGLERGRHFLVMEYVDGPSLAQVLAAARAARSFPSPATALALCRQLLEALDYLHGLTDEDGAPLEVVHRDVTPGNVLISRDGRVKLGDLGIARHRLRATRTRTGVIKGTVQYMAPEQVTGDTADVRTDLYGVGLILFELLTLRPFIHGEREVEILRLAEDPPWTAPSELRESLPEELDPLVRRALRRFPEERYRSAQAFTSALDQVADALSDGEPSIRSWIEELPLEGQATGTPMSDVALGGPPGGTQVAPAAPGRSRGWLLALLLAIPVALASFGLVLLKGSSGGEAPAPDGGSVDLRQDATPPDQRSTTPDTARDSRPPVDLTPAPKRPPTRRPRPKTKTTKTPVAPPAPSLAERRGPLREKLKKLANALASRGVLLEDLPPGARKRLQRVRGLLEGGAAELDAAERELPTLSTELSAVRVDRGLVEAKMKRVDRLLRKAGVPNKHKEQAGQALQEFMDGRYDAANRRLNRILRALHR